MTPPCLHQHPVTPPRGSMDRPGDCTNCGTSYDQARAERGEPTSEGDSTVIDQKAAVTMCQVREALGHVKPGQPEVIVSITRYAVSVLPFDDINRKAFTLFVERKPNGWVVTDGHAFYAEDGTWQPAQWLAHHWADCGDALAFARETAPEMVVNGHTATEVYQRTRGDDTPA